MGNHIQRTAAPRAPARDPSADHGIDGARSTPSVGADISAKAALYTDADLREAFEERAAIVEFDGGLSRSDAERLAWECVRR